MWDLSIWDVEAIKKTTQLVHCKARNKGGTRINITIVYGASTPRKREVLWNDLRELSTTTFGPWVVVGDFNEVRNRGDRIGARARVSLANMEDASLYELQSLGESMSWHNMRKGEEMISSKIDRAFINDAWWEIWPDTKSRLNFGRISVHALLIIELRKIKLHNKPFRFTNS